MVNIPIRVGIVKVTIIGFKISITAIIKQTTSNRMFPNLSIPCLSENLVVKNRLPKLSTKNQNAKKAPNQKAPFVMFVTKIKPMIISIVPIKILYPLDPSV